MSTRVAGRQVLRWTLRNATSPVFSPVQSGRCHHVPPPLSMGCRSLCSSTSMQSQQHNPEPSPLPSQPVTELSLNSLLAMGFTETQAEQMYEAASKARGRSAEKHTLSTLAALFILGLNASSVLKLLEKCPELHHVKDSEIHQRVGNLRKLGFVEGSLQRVVAYYPQILTVPVKRIKNVVLFLRERCLFTVQQVTDLLRDCPAIVQEDMDQLEYKFQYVYFRMGVKQAEMVKSKLFRFPLDEVRCRHCFLERRGLYHTPDKKGQTLIINPKLNSILNIDQDAYLKDVAMATAEEYDVFKKLMAREWQEEEQQQGDMEAAISDDDGDDDEEEDVETVGKSGYMRRRKK